MSLPAQSSSLASLYTGFRGLSHLKAAVQGHQSAKTDAEVAKQFEAIFINMMLKAMRKATPHNSLFGNTQQRLYQGLYDHQIAVNLSKGQGIGLESMIEKSLQQGRGMIKNQVTSRSRPFAASSVNAAPQVSTQTSQQHQRTAFSDRAFVQRILPYAKSAAQKIGVAPSVLVAQAALETGWGKHVPIGSDGKNSHNLLGIKAGSDWKGAKIKLPTLEYRSGVTQQTQASFRAYPSIKACFENYAHLITQHPRYQQAYVQSNTASGYLKGLEAGGYATDPAYASKVHAILKGNTLNNIMAHIKKSDAMPLT